MRIHRASVPTVVAAILVAMPPGSAGAQDTTVTTPYTIAAELSGAAFLSDVAPTELGKFEEYREVFEGITVSQALLRWRPAGSRVLFQFTGHDLGRRDQSLWGTIRQPGLFALQVRSDKIPHTYSSTARMLGTETSRGVYSLPSPRPDSVAWNTAPYLAPIRSTWKPTTLSLVLTPSPQWDSRAQYTRIAKSGDRPFSMSFGSPGGVSREVLEPTEHTIHHVRLAQSYTTDNATVTGSYDLSVFRNALTALLADNPNRDTDASSEAATGRHALAPNNIAHTVGFASAFALPGRTRITAAGSYAWWRQDAAFIPVTSNTAVELPTEPLPTSLKGRAGTSMLNLSVTSRPAARLTITGRARTYDFRDEAGVTEVPYRVRNDYRVQDPQEVHRHPFARKSAEAKVRWRFTRALSAYAGYLTRRTSFDSDHGAIPHYDEKVPSVGVVVSGNQWVSLRASYTSARRRHGGEYDFHESQEKFRIMSYADRNQRRFTLMSSLMVSDQVTLSGTWEIGRDEYPGETFGVKLDKSRMLGGDLDWSPSPRITLGIGYTNERYRNRLYNRYYANREGSEDNPTFDWIANNNDNLHMIYGSVRADLVPEKMEGRLTFTSSRSVYHMLASNPQTPTGGNRDSDNRNATAMDFPAVHQAMDLLDVAVRYRITPAWGVTVRYQGEIFSQDDWRTNDLLPDTGSLIFLGNDFRDYTARWLTVSLSYHPGLLRLGRAAI